MRDEGPSPDVAPPPLLDDYLRHVRGSARTILPATAIRTRSLDARLLLARAALGDTGTLDELLTAARADDRSWLSSRRKHLNTGVLAGLAQVLAMQDILPQDRTDGLAVYELIRHALGPGELSMGHQGLHAQLAFRWQDREHARELLAAYGRMTPRIRTDLETDLASPFTVGAPTADAGAWLARFCSQLPEPAPTLSDDATVAPFDRLTAAAVPAVGTGPLISVVVTAFRPDEGLITAVRSLLAQSWTELEVIVVDDASPAEYDDLLRRCRSLDDRIRVVRLAVNGGTYRARNAGLDASAGEFVTFLDSDDWSHPRRLELQVRPLLDDPDVMATTSDGISVTDDLLTTRPGIRSGRFNPSSLMIRRTTVLRRIGYFDQVRKAGDSEFIGRIGAAFDERALRHLDTPLALIRLTHNSLSRSEIRAFWMHPARTAYSSAYLRWHERIVQGTADPYRPAEPTDRPFAVPAHLQRAGGSPAEPVGYDVVLATDWTAAGGSQQTMLDELAALCARGLRVGVLQFEAYVPLLRRRRPLNGTIQDLINAGTVTHVQLTDEAEVALVMVRWPASLQFAAADPGRLRVSRVVVVADQAPAGRDGTARRYAPYGVTQAVRRLFGTDPLWCPQDPDVREVLLTDLTAAQLTAFDHAGPIDRGTWPLLRRRPPAGPVVLGRDLRDSAAGAAADRQALLRSLPLSTRMDVRLRGGPHTPRSILDKAGLPAAWLVYDDIDARAFLQQLDFYVDFPDDNTVEAFSRATVEALAVGCVVVLPHRFVETYGDAALYCPPDEVTGLVRRYAADPQRYAQQSRRGQEHVARYHQPESYVDLVLGLIDGAATSAPAPLGA